MTMNSSGPISLAGTTAGVSIEIENGGNGTTQISLNDTAVRSLAGVPSGAITMPTNFYGKANQFNYTISSNQTNLDLRSSAISAGWNGSSALVVTINSGVYISSNSTGTPALTVSGSFPGGVSLTNGGVIVGLGGNGNKGSDSSTYTNGSSGGLALSVSSAISITNNNIIAGGGGGGGGGGSYGYALPKGTRTVGGGGGGGGQSSAYNSSGGAGGTASGPGGVTGNAGNGGSSGGAGGGGAATSQGGGNRSGAGGSGGSWGSSGSGGQSAAYNSYPTNFQRAAPSGGQSGGGAVSGNSNITWVATGTRYGGIS